VREVFGDVSGPPGGSESASRPKALTMTAEALYVVCVQDVINGELAGYRGCA
jgi:hypothetical protein